MKKSYGGSVTVYLTLILTLVFAIVLSMLESARSSVGRAMSQHLLDTATESFMCDYYRPLFDRYHVYALDAGLGSREVGLFKIEEKIKNSISKNSVGLVPRKCSVVNTQMLCEDNGNHFISQAVEYEKLAMPKDYLTSLINKFSGISSSEKVVEVIAKRNEAEEKLAEIDRYTLALMRIIDGINVNAAGTANGGSRFLTEDNFLKRFFVLPVNQVNVGINNSAVFEAMKNHYVDPRDYIDRISLSLENCRQIYVEKQGIYELMEANLCQQTELEACLYELEPCEEDEEIMAEAKGQDSEDSESYKNREDNDNCEDNDSYEDKATAIDAERERIINELLMLCNEYELLHAKFLTLNTKEQTAVNGYLEQVGKLESICLSAKSKIAEAIDVISTVKRTRAVIIPLIDSFESGIETLRHIGENDLINELDESLQLMRQYTGEKTGPNVKDYDSLMETLVYDDGLLQEYLNCLSRCREIGTKADYDEIYSELISLDSEIERFSYDQMQFDYSKLTDKTAADVIVEEAQGLIKGILSDGILKLLIPSSTPISQAQLDIRLLPDVTEEEDLPEGKIQVTNENMSELTSLIGLSSSVLSNLKGALYQQTLFGLYCKDSFAGFADHGNTTRNILQYEHEYLLCGNREDKVNLAETAAKIMMMRQIFSCIYSFTNPELSRKAYLAAEAAVGFTGMPFLVSTAKYLILFLLATEQAAIETSSIMQGGKPVFVTNGNSFCVDIKEMLLFSPDFVQEKAERISSMPGGIGYADYISLLLMMKSKGILAERALGLIQENIRYEYDEDFFINNCIVSLEIKAEIESDASLANRINVSLLKDRIKGYGYSVDTLSVYR